MCGVGQNLELGLNADPHLAMVLGLGPAALLGGFGFQQSSNPPPG